MDNNNGYYYQNGNAPYNNQGADANTYSYNYSFQPQRPMPADPFISREAKHLTKLGLLAGAAILSFLGMQNIIGVLLSHFHLTDIYMNNYSFQMIVEILVSIICIFVPFLAVYALYPAGDKAMCFEFGKPVSKRAFLLALGAGVMICILSDYVSAGFVSFAKGFGVSFMDVDTKTPSNVFEFFIYTIQCAVVPALVEEFAIRGVIMQPLRRYGDRFAIVMSSLIFALMHGNMLQIPVALIGGVALGYFAIATKSIWTSVAIHFVNNFLAVIISAGQNDMILGVFYTVFSVVMVAVGIICLIKFIKTEHDGIGLTFAPKAEKTLLIIFSVLFIAFSYICTMFERTIGLIYIGFVIATAVVIYAYLSANKKELGNQSRGLSTKLMASLYIATPTVILAFFSLTLITFRLISFNGFSSYLFSFLLFAAYFAVSIFTISTVRKSSLIEYKKPYTISVIAMVILVLYTAILFFVS
ncbi:MAG: CPBP family intramembrane metalloprotease [Clostridia bacterium]|nr:CPBP family intramembrane metalloprotease [Clostridia bacterium]